MPTHDEIVRAAAMNAQSGRLDLAMPAVQEVLRQDPKHIEANRVMGLAHLQTGQVQQGMPYIERAIALAPHRADLHSFMGSGLAMIGQWDRAIESFDRALKIDPKDAQTHALLATCLLQRQDLDAAEQHYKTAIDLNPRHAEARTNYGTIFTTTGRPNQAAAILRDTAKDHPTHPGVLTNYCVALNYADGIDPKELLQAHTRYGQILLALPGGPPMQPGQFMNSRDPERKLRIGILSSDLFDHSVAYFVRPMLAHRDRSKVEYSMYSAGPKTDDITRVLKESTDAWRDVSRMNDQQLIAQVRSDAVDIFIELSGQTQRNRLAAVRLRGAPIQATYIGYPNTTGVPTIDYRLVDSLTDPAGAEAQAIEKLVRLDPCFLCYWPREDAPVPGPAPFLRSGHITFGSFNSIKKLAPEVVGLWCRLLQEVPDSRLIIKSAGFNSESACRHFDELFDKAGIAQDRVELRDRVDDKLDHLAAYDEIDIGLDTFPYNGTTTTCEALWMGVPVVSLIGRLHAGRVGLSLLSAIGHPELAAPTPDAYIAAAAGLARDTSRLAELHRTLRDQVRASPLCDAQAFARRFESTLRDLWRSFCKG